jgi:hypothetical protein
VEVKPVGKTQVWKTLLKRILCRVASEGNIRARLDSKAEKTDEEGCEVLVVRIDKANYTCG